MAVWQAIQSLIEVLRTIPTDVVPADHVSARRPDSAADLPAVVVAAQEVSELPAGLGRLVGTRRLSETAWSATTATRASGQFIVELWASDQAELDALAEAAFGQLEGQSEAVTTAGFLFLFVQSAGPIEQAGLGVAETETALKLPIGCSFSFETVTPEETGPDGIITHVDVEMREPPDVQPKDQFEEVMDIHTTP
jgi:hypothetical protein